MNGVFEKHYPTFKRLAVWMWNSPTFTTWGNFAAMSLRLLLVTPFILTCFNETEIAVWYLFASLNFFGTVVTQRLGLTFSRMFAFAMGGSSNLAPIKEKPNQENGGQPNWNAFGRAYGTIGLLCLLIAGVNVLIAVGMGFFGLQNLLEGYDAVGVIWLAFGLIQGSSLLSFIHLRYSIAIYGMNYVALGNRWGIVFSLLSVAAGSLTLLLGGGIVALVVSMQSVSLLGILRNRFILKVIEEGRVMGFRAYRFDREVFGWAWPPIWKGFIGQFGMQGSLQFAAIIYTAYGSKLEIASFLFAMRMMQTITQVAQAPFSSVQPMMSRLRAAGETVKLRALIKQRIAASLGLTLTGVAVGAVFFPVALDLIEAKLTFIPVMAWLVFGALTLLSRFNVLCCAVSAIGNEMVYYWEMAASAVLSVCFLLLIKNQWGVIGPIIASLVPMIFILHVRPFKKAVSILR